MGMGSWGDEVFPYTIQVTLFHPRSSLVSLFRSPVWETRARRFSYRTASQKYHIASCGKHYQAASQLGRIRPETSTPHSAQFTRTIERH